MLPVMFLQIFWAAQLKLSNMLIAGVVSMNIILVWLMISHFGRSDNESRYHHTSNYVSATGEKQVCVRLKLLKMIPSCCCNGNVGTATRTDESYYTFCVGTTFFCFSKTEEEKRFIGVYGVWCASKHFISSYYPGCAQTNTQDVRVYTPNPSV